jgi:hypothetical protein
MRETRRSSILAAGIDVPTIPPHACQTDCTRFDPLSGAILWHAASPSVHVGILARDSFTGRWSYSGRVGRIDLTTGENAILHESRHRLGWPVRVGEAVAFPWYTASRFGVGWVDDAGKTLRSASWPLKGTRGPQLHPVSAGLAVQTNCQRLYLLGDEDEPLWGVRVKQLIGQVHQAGSSQVFVGTNGRLLGFDLGSGAETFNFRPTNGGAWRLDKVPGHDVLVCPFTASRSYSVPPRLLVLNMRDARHELAPGCGSPLGTWRHGAVCRAWRDEGRLAVLDVRPEGRA